MFVEMIFNVPFDSVTNVLEFAETQSLFVSNNKLDAQFATSMPSYWDQFIELLSDNSALARSGSNCGCSEVDECLDETSCSENSICFNTDGSFDCICSEGFIKSGGQCVDYDECLDNVCHAQATCTNSHGSFECQCDTGYEGDGILNQSGCSDVNECLHEMRSTNCDVNAICSNTDGSFECICKDGFVGDGIECTDIDECANGVCNSNAVCINKPGTFECQCGTGYQGNGDVCDDVDECTDSSSCHQMASCQNTVGSFTCTCLTGYEGDGFTCSQDICSLCDSSATCISTDGTKDCQCATGFSGDGYTCDVSSLVVPITKMPLITVKSATCKDSYWLELAQTGQTTSISVVINDVFDQTWMPCLTMLADAGVKTYATVDVRGGKLMNTESYVQSLVNDLHTTFGDVIAGIHLTNPGPSGYIGSIDFESIISSIKLSNLLVSLDVYLQKWDERTALIADQLIIFNDNAPKFNSKCTNSLGSGPFCRQHQSWAKFLLFQ